MGHLSLESVNLICRLILALAHGVHAGSTLNGATTHLSVAILVGQCGDAAIVSLPFNVIPKLLFETRSRRIALIGLSFFPQEVLSQNKLQSILSNRLLCQLLCSCI